MGPVSGGGDDAAIRAGQLGAQSVSLHKSAALRSPSPAPATNQLSGPSSAAKFGPFVAQLVPVRARSGAVFPHGAGASLLSQRAEFQNRAIRADFPLSPDFWPAAASVATNKNRSRFGRPSSTAAASKWKAVSSVAQQDAARVCLLAINFGAGRQRAKAASDNQARQSGARARRLKARIGQGRFAPFAWLAGSSRAPKPGVTFAPRVAPAST